jgi:hypothetical protein
MKSPQPSHFGTYFDRLVQSKYVYQDTKLSRVHFGLFIPSSNRNILLLVLMIRKFSHSPHYSYISCDELLYSELSEASVLRFQQSCHHENFHPSIIFKFLSTKILPQPWKQIIVSQPRISLL